MADNTSEEERASWEMKGEIPTNSEYRHTTVNGIVTPPFFTQYCYDNALKIAPFIDGDVIISTYPKAGTTWTQKIVHLLRYGPIPKDSTLIKRTPWHECQAIGLVEDGSIADLPTPRTWKSHMDWHMTYKPDGVKVKYINVMRNGKDLFVSLFHHSRGFKLFNFNGNWAQLYQMAMSGNIEFGSYFDHVNSWFEAYGRDDVLILFYEDMIEDLGREIRKIADFLGPLCLPQTDESIADIVKQCTFNSMQNDPQSNYSLQQKYSSRKETAQNFIRSGTVGEWQDYFSERQSREFDEKFDAVVDSRFPELAKRFRYTL